jgi:hypothetical protein
MKKALLIALLAVIAVSLFGCRKKPEESFVDTLPCNQAGGYTWVARSTAGDTGQVYIEQAYRDDDTYTMLGASGVLENMFYGVVPGVATIRLYYVDQTNWNGSNSDTMGTAYYEFLIYDDLTISLLYSEVHLPDSF